MADRKELGEIMALDRLNMTMWMEGGVAAFFGSKFVLSYFWASGDYWGDIAEYRHVYSAI